MSEPRRAPLENGWTKHVVACGLAIVALTNGCAVDERPGAAPPASVNEEVGLVADTSTTLMTEPPDVLAAAPSEMEIRLSEFDGTWPFADDEVTVGCDDSQLRWVRTSGGVFGLNGAAVTAGFAELTLDTPSAVWLDNEATGFKVSLSDVAEIAGDLCS